MVSNTIAKTLMISHLLPCVRAYVSCNSCVFLFFGYECVCVVLLTLFASSKLRLTASKSASILNTHVTQSHEQTTQQSNGTQRTNKQATDLCVISSCWFSTLVSLPYNWPMSAMVDSISCSAAALFCFVWLFVLLLRLVCLLCCCLLFVLLCDLDVYNASSCTGSTTTCTWSPPAHKSTHKHKQQNNKTAQKTNNEQTTHMSLSLSVIAISVFFLLFVQQRCFVFVTDPLKSISTKT